MHKIKGFASPHTLLDGALKRLASGVRKIAKYLTPQYLAIWIASVALLVSMATLYLTFFRHIEDFRVYLRFPEPLEVGTNRLHLNYFFSNRGNEPVLIEDVSIIELWIKSEKQNIGGGELQACDNPTLLRPDFIAFLPPDIIKSKHMYMKSGAMFSVFRPVKTYIDGTEGGSSAATVDEGDHHDL
jgi:hypothetical protein